ncbi:MAG: chloride channel protein [Acidobacteria bacterium]|nr:chloride channel protein [Acidobacteriota bacterium]
MGKSKANTEILGDFTITPRVILITALAIAIGVTSAFVALGLLKLIGLFTNIFFYQRVGWNLVSPQANTLGGIEVLVPVAGALMIGFMARYGSERIRGHGIPEAIEAILMNGSKVEPKVALLKPLSSAISIGSGGPFGAEGPIIMTGGAFGSMIAQLFRLTSAERKTLLVAGAAGGMSATFAAPVAAVLLAVELLLFEWKPRSLLPVGLASAAAAATRRQILGLGPLFLTPAHSAFIGVGGLLGCAVAGLLAGLLSVLLTGAVYATEDAFRHLPVHWMWWPAIGGVVVGLGGLVFPQALGVGYDTIGALLRGDVPRNAILGILLAKSVIWAVSLGSGTSGGVLAPLLMVGGALGGVEAMVLPNLGPGYWPLVSMAAVLGGSMRAPFTAVIFAIELTHDINVSLPLLLSVLVSYGFTVLVLKRSILTEKVSRRGYHLSCEYAVDPLEILSVREVMRTNILALPGQVSRSELAQSIHHDHRRHGQFLYPLVDAEQRLRGVITHSGLQALIDQDRSGDICLSEAANSDPVVAYPDEPLRVAVNRMAETGRTRMPVVERGDGRKLLGMVSLADLLRARVRHLEEERRRERLLRVRFPYRPAAFISAKSPDCSAEDSSESAMRSR